MPKLAVQLSSMNTKALYQSIFSRIIEFESPTEAESITYLLLEHLFNLGRMEVILDIEINVDDEKKDKLNAFIQALANNQPIQHLIGSVEFYGRKFLVNRNVLIPRPETEELVDIFLKNHPKLDDITVVDIGCGSGIIPITIKKERPEAQVIGLDISHAALETAKRNAEYNMADVHFIQADILTESPEIISKAQVIISNPPYITLQEKAEMNKKVFEQEPDQALFVPNNQPLLFYERITKLAAKHLTNPCYLYFEINENYGHETKNMISEYNFKTVNLYKDMQGKDRFIMAILD